MLDQSLDAWRITKGYYGTTTLKIIVVTTSQVLCFVSAVLAGVLAVWSVLFLVRRWYYKTLQYMSLP
jgi:hypothetical protein